MLTVIRSGFVSVTSVSSTMRAEITPQARKLLTIIICVSFYAVSLLR